MMQRAIFTPRGSAHQRLPCIKYQAIDGGPIEQQGSASLRLFRDDVMTIRRIVNGGAIAEVAGRQLVLVCDGDFTIEK